MPICFKIKFYEDRVSKLNYNIVFFEPSTGNQNCLDKFLVNDEMNFIENKYQAF